MRKSHQNWIISLGHNKRILMAICETKVAVGRDCMEGKMYWFLLSCVCRMYVVWESILNEKRYQSWDLHIFNPPESERIVFKMLSLCVYVYIYVWVCASSVPEELKEFYSYSLFGSSSSYYMNMNILAHKIWALKMGPRKRNGDFLESWSDDLD